jgi:uncharacterized protein (DUF169 family)
MVELLGLAAPPVAVTFRDAPPAGMERVPRAAPSGCTYWQQAAAGSAFYTEAADHANCPVGAHTHGVALSPAQQQELQGLIGTMVSLEYLDMAEVAGIPTRQAPFGVAVYSPLDQAVDDPDVVLVRGSARQVMLLAEAANAAGVGPESPLMGRPTCAAIPAAQQSGRAVASLACIGNRVYTGLADGELYFAIPGQHVAAVVEKLATIVHANQALEQFHRERMETR